MADALGPRLKLAVLVPSTNTVVQPEFDGMRPEGVTNHISRIRIPNLALASDADFRRLVALIAAAQLEAVDSAMSCEPGHVVLGISVETFWGGLEASGKLMAELAAHTGLGQLLWTLAESADTLTQINALLVSAGQSPAAPFQTDLTEARQAAQASYAAADKPLQDASTSPLVRRSELNQLWTRTLQTQRDFVRARAGDLLAAAPAATPAAPPPGPGPAAP